MDSNTFCFCVLNVQIRNCYFKHVVICANQSKNTLVNDSTGEHVSLSINSDRLVNSKSGVNARNVSGKRNLTTGCECGLQFCEIAYIRRVRHDTTKERHERN